MIRRKKNSTILAIVAGLIAIGATAAVGYLSTGFQNWKLTEWKEKLVPTVEEPTDSISEDISSEI